jgi:predicted O-methyltransferase YrrM
VADKACELNSALMNYIRTVGINEPEVLRKLREETALRPDANMQITPEQGQLMRVLLAAMGAKNVLEVGVFTGYSSTAMALALPEDGRLVACDRNEEFTNIARRYWREAGVEHKIDLRLGPALKTLHTLLDHEGAEDSFDFVFIDADKEAYGTYYELALRLTRHGGIIAFDNTLWHGRVLDESSRDSEVVAIQELNRKIRSDERVAAVLLPIGDGMTIALKF